MRTERPGSASRQEKRIAEPAEEVWAAGAAQGTELEREQDRGVPCPGADTEAAGGATPGS